MLHSLLPAAMFQHIGNLARCSLSTLQYTWQLCSNATFLRAVQDVHSPP